MAVRRVAGIAGDDRIVEGQRTGPGPDEDAAAAVKVSRCFSGRRVAADRRANDSDVSGERLQGNSTPPEGLALKAFEGGIVPAELFANVLLLMSSAPAPAEKMPPPKEYVVLPESVEALRLSVPPAETKMPPPLPAELPVTEQSEMVAEPATATAPP